MKADRLLSALLLLQAHGRLTGRELAKRLEVSGRTVHRDMEALSAAGVPVFALRGARGGWQLDEGWRTQVPGLDEGELHALLMAQPRSLGDARLIAAAERAYGKLMASLPSSMRDRAVSMQQRLYVDPTGWRGTTENLTMLPVVQEALARERKLKLHYWRAGKERVERAVDPLGLVAKGSAWYLVARSEDAFRTYRVSRIETAEMLEAAVERPAGFDLAEYWKTSTAKFEEGLPRYDATLRLEPRAAKWLRMWRFTSPAQVVAGPDADGWVTMHLLFDHEEEAFFMVLGLGARVDVIEPAALRERIAAEAAAVLARLPTAGRAASRR